MAHTDTHAKTIPSRNQLPGLVSESMATAIAAFTAWRRAIAGRRALKDLTPDQLKDIGCPDTRQPKFVVRVGVGLMTDLMFMR